MDATKNKIARTDAMPLAELNRAFSAARSVLIVSHIDPDGDAIGTQLAFGQYLQQLDKQVWLVRDSEIPEKYKFLPGVDRIKPALELTPNHAIDTALILECPNMKRVGSAGRLLTPGVTVINIDHHRDNDYFGTLNWVDIRPSSVGEMAFEFFGQAGFQFGAEVAECLYTAILTDTGRFRFSSTSPRTMNIAGELIARGADPHKICDEVYYNTRPSTLKLMGKVLNGIEYHDNGRIVILVMTKDMLASSGATESESDGLVDFTLFSKGVVAGALLKEIDEHHTKASLRSVDGVNVSAIAYKYGGGGHFNAAGCLIPKSLDEAKRELITLLSEAPDGTL